MEERADTQSDLIDSIARVDLRVQDIDRSLSFYRDVVGLEVLDKSADRADLGPPGGSVILSLDSSGVSGPAEQAVTGLFHTAIRFPDRNSLGDALARLVEAGLKIGAGDHGVSEALYIDDPDGNGVELYRDRPRDQWPRPSGGMKVPMYTAPVDLHALLADSRHSEAVGDKAPSQTDIGHVHLQAADIAETVAFYAETMRLDLMARIGDQAAFFASHGYHHNLGANTWHSRGQGPARKDRAGLERIIFQTTEPAKSDLEQRLRNSAYETWKAEDQLAVLEPGGVELRFSSSSSAEIRREI